MYSKLFFRPLQRQQPFTLRCLLSFICLFLFSSPVAANNQVAVVSNSIHFIAAPYLSTLQYNSKKQFFILSQVKSPQELSDHRWKIITTLIGNGLTQSDKIHIFDQPENALYKLAKDHRNIAIRLPSNITSPLPVLSNTTNTAPLWLQYIKTANATWHSPSLTPQIARQVLADLKKTKRIAERMAERAFYFGYDTNDDALE